MSMAWYVNRLASMSPLEILHRTGEQVKRRISKRTSYGWEKFAEAGALPVLPGLKQALVESPSASLKAAARQAADQVLDGQFAALGVTWPKRDKDDLFPSSFWRLDPVSGGLWPGADKFCFAISYRHERSLGDIKYVWEANRLQFLQPLAVAWALFADARALAAIECAINSWVDANPPYQGLGWNSGIELAIRAVSILFVTSLCGDDLTAATRARIRSLLKAHLYWLHRYPSGFSSANNHLVAELMAEYLIGQALGGSAPAGIARKAALHLAKEADLQILADGVPAEQSPTYGAFTAEMLLLCSIVGRASGHELPANVAGRLTAFAHFIEAIADQEGRVPAFGDDDEGRVLTLGLPEPTYATSIGRAIAGYAKVPMVLPASDTPGLIEALVPAPSLAPGVKNGISTFRDGGYSVIRDEVAGHRMQLMIDHGPLGYLSIAAHGHADANAITLSIDGRRVFIDPGTYLYHSGGAWRDWFRGTRAHNTLTVAGVDQSEILGPFNWGKRAQASLVNTTPAPEWSVQTLHDGYQVRFGVQHRRTVTRQGPGFCILDELVPPKPELATELVFQLAPELAVIEEEGRYKIAAGGKPILALSFEPAGQVKVATGLEDLDGGWASPHFGAKVPASRLSWSGPISAEGVRTRLEII